MAFIEALQQKYQEKCFKFCKLPLQKFLQALIEKERCHIRYGYQKQEPMKERDNSPSQP